MKLLQIELLKNFKNRRFWIMFGLFFLFMMIFYGETNLIVRGYTADSLYSFPKIWSILGYTTRIFSYILGIIAISMITNEISYRTLRQNVIDGMSREKFLLSKLMFMGVVSVLTMVVLLVYGLIYGFNHTPDATMETAMKNMYYVPLTGLFVFGFMVLSFLVGLLTKRTGIAVVALVLYLSIVEPLLRLEFEVPYFLLPGWSIGSLLPVPTRLFSYDVTMDLVLVNLMVISALIGACYLVLKKRDL